MSEYLRKAVHIPMPTFLSPCPNNNKVTVVGTTEKISKTICFPQKRMSYSF